MDANATPQYSAPAWGQSPFADLTLPSGAKIQARRLDLQILVETDLVEEMDSVSGSLQSNVVEPANGRGKPQDRKPKKLTKKQQQAKDEKEARESLKGDDFKTISRMLQRLLPAVILQPPVLASMEKVEQESGGTEWRTIPPEDREEGKIYADTIPLGDQMHVMNWCMEGMDLEAVSNFREQSDEGVGDVEDESELRDEAE